MTKCYNCGFEGDILDFIDLISSEHENWFDVSPFKVCPKCKKVQ